MKEASGEVSMTVITLVAIGIIGGILALMWPNIKSTINGLWGGDTAESQCVKNGGTWDAASGRCL